MEPASRYRGFALLEWEFVSGNVPGFEWVVHDRPSPRNVLERPLAEARVALVATCGARLSSQEPFKAWPDHKLGDHTYREIPSDAERLRFNHGILNTKLVYRDPEVVFPLRTLRELAADGAIGGLNGRSFSFMGYCPYPEPLVAETGPEVARSLLADEVDLAFLVPA